MQTRTARERFVERKGLSEWGRGRGKVAGAALLLAFAGKWMPDPQGKESLPRQNRGHASVPLNGTRVLTNGRVRSRPDRCH